MPVAEKKRAGGLLGVLHRAGLVQLEDSDSEPGPGGEQAPGSKPVSIPAAETVPAPGAVPEAHGAAAEDQPLDQIYAEAGVPSSPFPAERMLKVLAGLRAMDINTRRAAVLAIDAADDNWKIEDVLLDTDRKIKALEAHKLFLVQQASDAQASANEEIAARDRKQQEAVAAIRQQMADLQALMEREVANATHDKKDAEARGINAREGAQRESARLDQEITRLREIPSTFPTVSPTPG
jgi:hypothetical protein